MLRIAALTQDRLDIFDPLDTLHPAACARNTLLSLIAIDSGVLRPSVVLSTEPHHISGSTWMRLNENVLLRQFVKICPAFNFQEWIGKIQFRRVLK